MRTYDLQQEDAAKTSEFFHFDAVDRLTCSTFAACRPGDLSCYGGPPSPGVVRPVADVRPQPDAGFAPSIAPAQGKSARDRSARGSPPRAPEACLVPSIWCPAGKSITWAIVRCATTAGGSPPRGTRLARRARRQVSDIFRKRTGRSHPLLLKNRPGCRTFIRHALRDLPPGAGATLRWTGRLNVPIVSPRSS
jgi:hypothetical protein